MPARIAIVYATTEGQTRKVARFAADRLVQAGHAVELLRAEDAEGLDLGRFDAAILAGSVHVGAFQGALKGFAYAQAEALARLPTLFLPVSLAVAGDDPDDREGIEEVVEGFVRDTGWRPGRIEHVAGAFRFGEYGVLKSWAMRWIARQKGEAAPARGEDREYTDWERLGSALDDWAAGLCKAT
ncbi:MAG: protoporphyrinogen oxidase [Rhodobacteraceae bacterium]|nr:protoporphyrinogen oxidase [Paracoccaceae bacterium]